MKKKVIAFLCALALLVGLLPAGVATTASATTTNQYQVGYAIKDINPWADYNDHSKGLNTDIRLFLSGNGNDEKRLATELYDDNGDGDPGDGDGLFTTATVITDHTGKTVVYITIDSLQGYDSLTSDVRAAIMQAISGVSKDQIMISASHTHSGFQLEYLKRGYYSRTKNEDGTYTCYGQDGQIIDSQQWIDYYDHIIAQIKEAATEAWYDRAAATMSKGTVNANTATKNLGYNKDQDGNPQGYHMNAIRHYEVTATGKYKIAGIIERTVEKKYIIGSSGDPFDKADFNNFDPSRNYTSVSNTFKPVEESDNDLHVLLFEFDDSDEKLPVVFVNWRAHTTANSSVNIHALSSDYVNGLRTTLNNVKSESAPNGYRVAFFQGAAGNVVATARDEVWQTYPTYKDWMNHIDSQYGAVTNANKTFIYGKMLAEIAQYCIQNNMVDLSAGKIRTHQMTWHGVKQADSDGLRAAAEQIDAEEAAGNTTNYPYRFSYDADGDGKTELYIVNSSYHKKNISNRKSASASYTNLELNVIMLGDNVAFVTAPDELADKYHEYGNGESAKMTDGVISATEDNDWHNLINNATYGTPFVLGYSNGSRGYIGNWLDHAVNSPDYTTITGFASGAESIYGPGTYESYTSRLAQGQGEALIAQYKTMLDSVNDIRVAECEICDKDEVEWLPIYNNGEFGQYNSLKAGHYYLADDISDTGINGQWSVGDGSAAQTTCIDLMGHDKTSESRNFIINTNATLNLIDSVGTGEVLGKTYTDNTYGGNILVQDGGVFNLYGGTLSFEAVESDSYKGTGRGGVVYLQNTSANAAAGGIMNMYGGTIEGANMVMSNETVDYNGCGGAVFVRYGSALNVYGGTIQSGSVPEGAYGPCVYAYNLSANVTLSGNANVEDIYFAGNSGNNLTIKGEYKGTAGLSFDPTKTLSNGLDIGNCIENASISDANITCVDAQGSEYGVYIDGSDLKLSHIAESTSAIIYGPDGQKEYVSLSDAISEYSSGYIKLAKNVTDPVVVNKNVTIDLSGYSISDVTVNQGYTLYGLDSKTDDYTVADGKYGKIAKHSGNVVGVTAGSGDILDNYLKITETAGISFHRVNLQVHTMSLRPFVNDKPEPGVYYKSYFAGDEKVEDHVESFGVALSVYEMPNAKNMDIRCKYSEFANFKSGEGSNDNNSTGTLLTGIMRESNATSINNRNANLKIYGRAYVKLDDGSYLFGIGASRTLKEQIEAIDANWAKLDETKKQDVVALCEAFANVTNTWNIPNIAAQFEDDNVLRVLTIGHSLSNDANWLLSLVAKAEGYENLKLGFLYYSGCKLSQHVQFMNNDSPEYDLYTTSTATGGEIIPQKFEKVTMKMAVKYDDWDIIVMQGGVFEIARDATYKSGNIQRIQKFVNEYKKNPNAVFGWNFAWAPPADESLREGYSVSESYANAYKEFDGKRENMYNAIINCVSKNIVTDDTFKYVIPSGTIFENALSSYLEEADMHRDYVHATDLARVMVSYLWFCKLTGVEQLQEIKLDAIPVALLKSTTDKTQDRVLTENEKAIILETVNNALKNPLQTTQSQYTQAPAQ